MAVKKAVITIAGLGTRFLPLSKVVPKEFWPLVDKPILQYIIEEAEASGIKKIIFVNQPHKEIVLSYFKKYLAKSPGLEEILKLRKKRHLLKDLEGLEKISKRISFSQVVQKKPLGDAHAILQTEKLIGKEPFAVLFADDVVEAKRPCLSQLINVFEKYRRNKPAAVLALYRVPRKKLPSYGVVKAKKIGKRIYKIEKIVEKPSVSQAPSNLAIVGKYILSPEVFKYFKKAGQALKKEIFLSENLEKMLQAGKTIYGCEFDGKWLECGNKAAYLKSNLYLSLKHKDFGKKLKKHIAEIK